MENKDKNLEYKRHTLAHLMASAVLELYPETQNTIGPAIDNGFYYDFEFKNPITEKDLKEIEKKMRKNLSKWDSFSHKEVSEEEARDFFKDNPYKQELITEILEKGEKITLYTAGDFTDLCRGGHSENPSKDIGSKSFQLDKIAGAYWRGDEKNKMLTRIYGLAFDTEAELNEYLEQRQEAEKRDHRKLGKELDLFTFSDLVGPGLPLFTPNGTAMRDAIVEKINSIQKVYSFKKVTIPHITKPDLYKTSGHWEKFGDELFHVKSRESEFVMKPMNCPHHTQIYASKMRSYKDLPLRLVETTMVYRDEQTGELQGLSRVRAITQDDGHIFCTREQMSEEIKIIVDIIKKFYTSLGMLVDGKYYVSLSVSDPNNPEKYLGDRSIWEESESILENVAKEMKLPYKRIEGEAAFYGPKLDFMFKDSLGKEWQLGTVQLDFNMPNRFGLEYTDSDGTKKKPVMIHRAIAGSLERFLSMAIPHFNGNFPLWLSPVQVAIIPIADNHHDLAKTVAEKLQDENIRFEIYDSNDGIGKKIRNAKNMKIPYYIVIGDEELRSEKVTLESRDDGKIGMLAIDEILERLNREIEQ